jgi:hypothetical protein
MNKSISFVLLATILIQSCVAYQKKSVSIEEACNRGQVRLTTTSGMDYTFSHIYLINSKFYGDTEPDYIRIDTSKIASIYLKTNKKSRAQTTIFVSVVGLLCFGLIVLIVATGEEGS